MFLILEFFIFCPEKKLELDYWRTELTDFRKAKVNAANKRTSLN